jgi:hypothetical protein
MVCACPWNAPLLLLLRWAGFSFPHHSYHLRSGLDSFPGTVLSGQSQYGTASTAPTAYRPYGLRPTAHVFSSKSPYATASTVRTAYRLPPLRPAAYGLRPVAHGLRPTAYGLPFISHRAYSLPPAACRLPPAACRLPPAAYHLPPPAWASIPVRSGSASVLRPHQISQRPTPRDPGCLPCSRLRDGLLAYTLCSRTPHAPSVLHGTPHNRLGDSSLLPHPPAASFPFRHTL